MKNLQYVMLTASLAVGMTFFSHAQKHDYNWMSGYGFSPVSTNFGGSDIDFNSWPPKVTFLDREMDFFFNSGSISDENGVLMFYTNGCYINGRDHMPLLNGDSLNPGYMHDQLCSDTDGYRTMQGSIFLPHPTNNNLYYLFHHGMNLDYIIGGITEKFYYTLLDKTLDNGRGDVVEKNQAIIEDTLAGGITMMTRHANGRDWWIVVPEMASPKHFVLLLTPEGVEVAHEQWIGMVSLDDDRIGNAAFSPNGSIYARYDGHNHLNLFDFDRCAGLFSNPKHWEIEVPLDTAHAIPGSVAFSTDSRYLYVMATWLIYQYDLWAADVQASEQIVAEYEGGDVFFKPTFFSSQLGPDGRIYINATNGVQSFHVIEFPNRIGTACKVNQSGFPLPTFNGSSMCFFPNYRLGPLDGSPCDTLGINNEPLANFRWDFEDTLAPLQVTFTDLSAYEPSEWIYDFGDNEEAQDTSPVHTYNEPGIYTVCQTVSNVYGEDTQCYDVPVGVMVSADEELFVLEALVFPNPFVTTLYIKLPKQMVGENRVALYDNVGRLVANKTWFGSSLEWHLEDLPAGIHFYEIETQYGQKGVGKIIKTGL